MSYKPLVLRTLGFLSLAVAVGGAFIPLVPTVPFLILAAFLFSKSSVEWHHWILNHPKFGKTVRDWEEKGIIRWPIKVLTGSCIISTMLIPFFIEGSHIAIRIGWVALLSPLGLYLVTRPSDG